MKEEIITIGYLYNNPSHVFVFGDNTLKLGYGGAASLRHMTNTYGFITKKYPTNVDSSFYRPDEYKIIFEDEIEKLRILIEKFPNLTFLISKLGAGLANKYQIFEAVIEPNIKTKLDNYSNVKFLWE